MFEAIFTPICHGDIDLGEDELVEEMLSIDVNECVRHFIASSYATTPLDETSEAARAWCSALVDRADWPGALAA